MRAIVYLIACLRNSEWALHYIFCRWSSALHQLLLNEILLFLNKLFKWNKVVVFRRVQQNHHDCFNCLVFKLINYNGKWLSDMFAIAMRNPSSKLGGPNIIPGCPNPQWKIGKSQLPFYPFFTLPRPPLIKQRFWVCKKSHADQIICLIIVIAKIHLQISNETLV